MQKSYGKLQREIWSLLQSTAARKGRLVVDLIYSGGRGGEGGVDFSRKSRLPRINHSQADNEATTPPPCWWISPNVLVNIYLFIEHFPFTELPIVWNEPNINPKSMSHKNTKCALKNIVKSLLHYFSVQLQWWYITSMMVHHITLTFLIFKVKRKQTTSYFMWS